MSKLNSNFQHKQQNKDKEKGKTYEECNTNSIRKKNKTNDH